MGRKRKVTGLDLRHLVRELLSLDGKILKKAYLLDEGVFSLFFYPEVDGSKELVIDLSGFIFLTDLKWPKPRSPPPFIMALRKHLEGRRFTEISQVGVERILRLSFGDMQLVVELFGGGNLILVQEGEILLPLKRVEFRGRSIRPGDIYRPPAGPGIELDPSDRDAVLTLLRKGVKERLPLWKVLIGSFGVGPPYMDEISHLMGVDLKSPLPEIEALIAELADLIHSFLNRETEPMIYVQDSEVVNFSAFPLHHLQMERRSIHSLSRAIQLYYTAERPEYEEDQKIRSLEVEIQRQEELKKEYAEKAEEYRSMGDLIYLHLTEVDEALKKARKGISPPPIVSVDRKSGKVVLNLDGREIELDMLKSATENASEYYNRAKKYREKHERIDTAILSLKEKLNRLRTEAKERASKKVPTKRRKLRWYERFRWFYTSGGFLVIGGRDAQTNAEIVSKYLDENDLFFHVDMPGGSVVVLKLDGREPDEASVNQAATAAGVFSRAWREGLTSVDVYYVKGSQVSKHAPSGLYLPKGSFYITGRRNYLRVRLEICVGFQKTPDGIKLTAAPPGAPLLYSVCLRPGSTGKEEAAKVLKNVLEGWLQENIKIRGDSEPPAEPVEVSVDDIVRALPPGKVTIVE